MDKLELEFIKDGKDINEVLNMPYYYILKLLEDGQKPKQEKSLIAAFGGSSPNK